MLNISLTAGGASVASLEAKPKAARGVPVSRVFELTGIESGDEERKKGFAERSLWAAKPHEGVSELAVDTCLISAVAIRKAPSSPRAFCD